MSFTTTSKTISLEVSLPTDIIDYINTLYLELEEKEENLILKNLFTTLIENLYLNRYRKLLTEIYLSKILLSLTLI